MMVLVSKLRSASPAQVGGANSFLNKIRSTFTRSSSCTSLQVQVASKSGARSKGAVTLSCVQSFDENVSCDSSTGKRSESPDSHVVPLDNMVLLADLGRERSMPECRISKTSAALPTSICGTQHEQKATAAACHEPELDAHPISPGPAARRKPDVEELPGTILGGLPTTPLAVEVKSAEVGQSEVPKRLWDPADPPAQAHPAWLFKRDMEAPGPVGTKNRFPSRLPPLSKGLSSKSARRLTGSTPVLEVSNLPEPTLSPGGRK